MALMDPAMLLDRVAAGQLSPEQCGRMLRDQYGAPQQVERDDAYVEDLNRRTDNSEVDEFTPGSVDEVTAAYMSGKINDEQYAIITKALTGDTDGA